MKIEDVKVGMEVFIKSYRKTQSTHGINDDMRHIVGKFRRVEDVDYGSVRMIGYIWHPGDLALDAPNPVFDVPLKGSSVFFNPETL